MSPISCLVTEGCISVGSQSEDRQIGSVAPVVNRTQHCRDCMCVCVTIVCVFDLC